MSRDMDDESYRQIIKDFADTESVKETALKNGVSEVKVRRVLITEGLWSSATSDEIQRLLGEGKSVSEIAGILCTSEKAVQQYLPYRRGIYMGENRSVAALNSEEYRKRIEVIKEKVLRKKESGDILDAYKAGVQTEREEIMRAKSGSMIAGKLTGLTECEDTGKPEGKPEATNPLVEQYPGIVTFRELPDDKRRMVEEKGKMQGEDIYRLHLEIVRDLYHCFEGTNTDEHTELLRKYGGVVHGSTISRDILVPGSLPLYSLHYVIQRLFGWQNSHLHRFELSEDRMKELCDDSLARYVDLIGILFRSPWMHEEDEFWADDYEGGSFKTWLRKKYSGYQLSLCHGESYFRCRKDVKKNLKRLIDYTVSACAGEVADPNLTKYLRKDLLDHYEKIAETAKTKGDDAAFALMNTEDIRLLVIEHGGELLERLSVEEVFYFGQRRLPGDEAGERSEALLSEPYPMSYHELIDEAMLEEIGFVKKGKDAPDNQPFLENICKELIYYYDFGDGWKVRIAGSMGCEDLVEAGRITQEELDDAILQIYTTYRPVVIAQDGLSVFDDVGGMDGYCEFLKGTYGEREYDGPFEYADSRRNLEWARSLGWSRRRSGNKSFL